ncbi:MAG: hypothetical protein RM338_04655 [Nostoc sp. DedQUE12a]|nr:hypothetical protein [Nostoc sp. DedQUE12a]
MNKICVRSCALCAIYTKSAKARTTTKFITLQVFHRLGYSVIPFLCEAAPNSLKLLPWRSYLLYETLRANETLRVGGSSVRDATRWRKPLVEKAVR